jgi:hypothetical protein
MNQKTPAMAANQGQGFKQYAGHMARYLPGDPGEIVLWAALCEVIEPHSPKAGNGCLWGANVDLIIRASVGMTRPLRRQRARRKAFKGRRLVNLFLAELAPGGQIYVGVNSQRPCAR